jgi:hypothetical protein
MQFNHLSPWLYCSKHFYYKFINRVTSWHTAITTTLAVVRGQTFAQVCANLATAPNIGSSVLYGADTCLFVASVSGVVCARSIGRIGVANSTPSHPFPIAGTRLGVRGANVHDGEQVRNTVHATITVYDHICCTDICECLNLNSFKCCFVHFSKILLFESILIDNLLLVSLYIIIINRRAKFAPDYWDNGTRF